MKIVKNNFNLLADNLLERIDMEGEFETDLCDKFSKLKLDGSLLEILKTFNEHIIYIDTEVQQYMIEKDGKKHRLGFSRLSTGERIFVVSFMADKTKTKIILYNELGQLDLRHIKMFFKLWINSDYVDIIIPNGVNGYYIKRLYEMTLGSR